MAAYLIPHWINQETPSGRLCRTLSLDPRLGLHNIASYSPAAVADPGGFPRFPLKSPFSLLTKLTVLTFQIVACNLQLAS